MEQERTPVELPPARFRIQIWPDRAIVLRGKAWYCEDVDEEPRLWANAGSYELAMILEIEKMRRVVGYAQAVLTALNAGDVQKDSLLHKKLRKVMTEYRNVQSDRT